MSIPKGKQVKDLVELGVRGLFFPDTFVDRARAMHDENQEAERKASTAQHCAHCGSRLEERDAGELGTVLACPAVTCPGKKKR